MNLREIILSYHPCEPHVIEEVEKASRLERWERGTLLVEAGSSPQKIFFLREGIVRVGYSRDDFEDTLLFGVDGDIWMEIAAWFGDPHGATFEQECMTDTEAYTLSFEECRRLMSLYPEWMKWMLQTALGQLLMMQKKYEWFNSRSAADRYEAFNQRRKLANFVPLKYVAQYIGVTPSSLSRIRAKFRR